MNENEKYLIEFLGEKKIYSEGGQSILNASLSAGIPHFHVCGGNAKCSTCRVLISEGAESLTMPNKKEQALREKMHFPLNVRLACQTHVHGDGVKLRRIIQDETDIDLYIARDGGEGVETLGEEKEPALLFLDIRNFTRFVEHHLAFDVIHIVRKLFSAFQKIVESNNGVILETTGDGFYAVFGYKEKEKRKRAQFAVQAANEILESLEYLNKTYFLAHFEEKIEVGIGIHIGKVVSGEVKIAFHNRPIVMGFAVNIASRLQNATKEFNNNLIVSEDIYNLLAHRASWESRTILLKGVSYPVTIYLLGQPYSNSSVGVRQGESEERRVENGERRAENGEGRTESGSDLS
jgi:adenylate cyclase